MLVEIDGGFDIGRNKVVVDADAIDLDGEQDRDFLFGEGAGKLNGGIAAKALAEDDDTSVGGFSGVELSVAVGVERLGDELECGRLVVIAKRFGVGIGEITKFESESTDATVGIVPAFVAAEEADDEGVGGGDGRESGKILEALCLEAANGEERELGGGTHFGLDGEVGGWVTADTLLVWWRVGRGWRAGFLE